MRIGRVKNLPEIEVSGTRRCLIVGLSIKELEVVVALGVDPDVEGRNSKVVVLDVDIPSKYRLTDH